MLEEYGAAVRVAGTRLWLGAAVAVAAFLPTAPTQATATAGTCSDARILLHAGQVDAAEKAAVALLADPATAACGHDVLRGAIAARVVRARALTSAGESDLAHTEIMKALAEAPPHLTKRLRRLLRGTFREFLRLPSHWFLRLHGHDLRYLSAKS